MMNACFVRLKLYMLNACCVLVRLRTAQQDPIEMQAVSSSAGDPGWAQEITHKYHVLYHILGLSLTSNVL